MHNFSSIYSATDGNDSILNHFNPNSPKPNNTLIEINLRAQDNKPRKKRKGSRPKSNAAGEMDSSAVAQFGGLLNSQYTSVEDSIRN